MDLSRGLGDVYKRQISYPMSIWTDNISSIKRFKAFLENVIKVADRGEFSGEPGNRITLK
jgi:hypothetical protein